MADSSPRVPPPVHASNGGPVDVPWTDATGEVDLGQLEYNLKLTPLERIEQNDAWVEFLGIARRAGQRLYGEKTPA